MEFKIILGEQTPAVDSVGPIGTDISSIVSDNQKSLYEFLEFAKSKDNAVGLAANQVSLDGERFMHRCFAIRDFMGDGSWRLIFNPFITEYSGIKIQKSEGCLTWPGKKIISERSRTVKVSYYDIAIDGRGKVQTSLVENEEHSGFDGQIWQHEINHLNGVEERVEQGDFILHVKEPGRNDKCPCDSGKKYKVCCHSFVNPKLMRRPQPSMDSQLAKAGQRLLGNNTITGQGKV